MGDYKDSLKEIAQLYNDRSKRAAARGFMLSCKESGIKYDVALSLLKSSATIPAADSVSVKPDFKVLDGGQDKSQDAAEKTEINQNTTDNTLDLEVVEDSSGLDMAEIENKVYSVLDDFKNRYDIEDMTKEPQTTWTAFATYAGKHIFKGTKILKQSKLVPSTSAASLSNNNAYDIDKIVQVLNFYVYLCNLYRKTFTLWAAAEFMGVNADFLKDHEEKLTLSGFHIREKSEQSLVDGITDGKKNPTGTIAYLNARFGYAKSVAENQQKSVNIAVIYPTLPDIKAAQSLPGE